ncbi:hypothetical protein BH10PSE1_BH10PSE1_03250 [soil metagenome]
MLAVLRPFPNSPNGPIERIEVQLIREGGVLWLRYTAMGDMNGVAWPDEAPQARTDDLWRHTCFEAFVGGPDGYREYNLAPSRRWASYDFDGYRSGMREAAEIVTIEPLDLAFDQLAIEARIELPFEGGNIGLSAVIEDIGGNKTYWALAHPSDKPDFHHPDSFTLVLPAPEHP